MESYPNRHLDDQPPHGAYGHNGPSSRRDFDGPDARDNYAQHPGRSIDYDEPPHKRSLSRSRSPGRRGQQHDHYRERSAVSRTARPYDRHFKGEDLGEGSGSYSSRSDWLRASQDLNRAPRRRRSPYAGGHDYYHRFEHREENGNHYSQYDYEDDDPYVERKPIEEPALYDGEDDIDPEGKATLFLLLRKLKESASEELVARGVEKLYRSEDAYGATPGSLRRIILIRDRKSDRSACFAFAEFFTIADSKAAASAAHALGSKMTIASKQVEVSHPSRYNFQQASFGKPERNPRFLFELQEGEKYKYKIPTLYPSVFTVNGEAPHQDASQTTQQSSQNQTRVPDLKPTPHLDEPKPKKRKAQAGGALPAQLAQWQKKTEELRQPGESIREPDKNLPTIVPEAAPVVEDVVPQSFIHGTSCYLCKTVIASSILEKHVRESKAHAKHLGDHARVDAAYAFMKQKGVDPMSTLKVSIAKPNQDESSQSNYIDRAALRRQGEAHARGVSIPSGKPHISLSLKDSAKNKSRPQSPSPPPDPPIKTFGLGSKLLQKAGWKEGQGLGAQGEGRTQSIEQGIYAAGVGLGHASSRRGDALEEAERATKGGGFADKTRELARDRFNAMK